MTRTKVILVIEDEPSILALLCDLLEGEGYQVHTATDGQSGLGRLAEAAPDLVLCDVMMPGMDGRAVCSAIYNNRSYRSIPIILMSAVAESSLGLDSAQYSAFMPKPINLDALLGLIERLTP
ncbi:MAG: response regulator [Ardenticatenales bacterium]|nr:response regulator [Ardenticatenales bacterium]